MKQTDFTVGELVTLDFRAADIFKKAGIDFCCGGKQRLDEACKQRQVDPVELLRQLDELQQTPISSIHRFNDWSLDFLCEFIANTHHRTVLRLLPQLTEYTQKIAQVHGVHHPELQQIAVLFSDIDRELRQHLHKEETALFPAIKEALLSHSYEAKATVVSEITRMLGEHEFAGGSMDEIRILSHDYQVLEDACNTYRVAFKLLEEFEDDLHIHVHLENNILYPKALLL
jgi:regulator of cell morphogenesis and NO signaling